MIRASPMMRLARMLVVRELKRLKNSRLVVRTLEGHDLVFGDTRLNSGGAFIEILDDNAFRRIMLSADIGLAEGYMHGEWNSPDLRAVIAFFIDNVNNRHRLPSGTAKDSLVFARSIFGKASLSGFVCVCAWQYCTADDPAAAFLWLVGGVVLILAVMLDLGTWAFDLFAQIALNRYFIGIFRAADRVYHLMRPNDKITVRKNISAHYDLSTLPNAIKLSCNHAIPAYRVFFVMYFAKATTFSDCGWIRA